MTSENLVTLSRDLAHRAHEGQFRRDGVTPYVVHPQAVASRVAGDPIAESVAWLHDVLEDTPLTEADLRQAGIPDEVIAGVLLLTKTEGMDYESYLAGVKASPLARKVKVADMLTNLGDCPTERQILKYARGLQVLLQ